VGVSDEKSKRLALVFELMDKNLYEYIRGRKVPLNQVHVKSIIYENILLQGDKVKLADFGSCKGCFSPQPHTEYISTRWYRPPECLMTDGYYNSAMDVWGLGCVLFEIITFYPLFAGENEMDQINKINQVLGSPSRELLARFQKNYSFTKLSFKELPGSGIEKLLPKESPECVDLLKRMLCYDPDKRISTQEALQHPYFQVLNTRINT
jgi:renal tumor antigen